MLTKARPTQEFRRDRHAVGSDVGITFRLYGRVGRFPLESGYDRLLLGRSAGGGGVHSGFVSSQTLECPHRFDHLSAGGATLKKHQLQSDRLGILALWCTQPAGSIARCLTQSVMPRTLLENKIRPVLLQLLGPALLAYRKQLETPSTASLNESIPDLDTGQWGTALLKVKVQRIREHIEKLDHGSLTSFFRPASMVCVRFSCSALIA